MGNFYDSIPASIASFIRKQHVFFVGTAPLSSSGHVNLSPKGYNTFSILSDTQVAYLDFAGSGIETLSHVRENGRIVFCFCNFEEGAPGIYRLWGRAKAYERGSPEFDSYLQEAFGGQQGFLDDTGLSRGMRSIIVADIYQCSHSCGYGVPIMEYKKDRDTYINYAGKKKGGQLLEAAKGNQRSLDGLPGLDIPDPAAYMLPDTPAAACPGKAAAAGGGKCKAGACKAGLLPGFGPAAPTLLLVLLAWLCGAIMARAM